MRELTMNEVEEVNGGDIATGIALIALGIALASGAGIAALAVGGAFAQSSIVATTSLSLVAAGGVVTGAGVNNKEYC